VRQQESIGEEPLEVTGSMVWGLEVGVKGGCCAILIADSKCRLFPAIRNGPILVAGLLRRSRTHTSSEIRQIGQIAPVFSRTRVHV
jgi:hypothetical protein